MEERDAVRTIVMYSPDGGVTWEADPSGGLIVVSPNGTAYVVTVSDAGVLSAVAL